MNSFKTRLKELRLATELTYSQLASEFGKSEGAIRAWETGRTTPDADILISLAKYFKVSTDYLLGVSDTKTPENEDIAKRLGLSEKAIDILENKFRLDNRNPFTLTVNTLIEWPALLLLISEYLYNEIDPDTSLQTPTFFTRCKYGSGGFHYIESDKDFDYMEPSGTLDVFDTEKFKKLVMISIQEALAHLLEKENGITHF